MIGAKPGSGRKSNRKTMPESSKSTYIGFRKATLREKADYVKRHFSSIAGKYDFMNTLLSLGIHYFWKHRAVRMARLKPGSLVIDVCGGTGDLAVCAIRRLGEKGRVVLYDINGDMMEYGRRKIAKLGLEDRIRFVQGDAQSISFPDNLFDTAMIGFGIRNVADMNRCLGEIYRVLKPGGTFICLEFSLPTASWFRLLYDFYSFRVMPMLGKMLTGSREAYLHLPESIRMFPPPGEFAAQIAGAGFSAVTYKRLTNGIVVVYTGVKP